VVADEDEFHLFRGPPASLWIVDLTMEKRPVPIATFQIDALDGTPQPRATACHQPVAEITGSEVPVAWFAHGMRASSISDARRRLARSRISCLIPCPVPSVRRATMCSWTSAG